MGPAYRTPGILPDTGRSLRYGAVLRAGRHPGPPRGTTGARTLHPEHDGTGEARGTSCDGGPPTARPGPARTAERRRGYFFPPGRASRRVRHSKTMGEATNQEE